MFGWLSWCNSGWWRYQLNSSQSRAHQPKTQYVRFENGGPLCTSLLQHLERGRDTPGRRSSEGEGGGRWVCVYVRLLRGEGWGSLWSRYVIQITYAFRWLSVDILRWNAQSAVSRVRNWIKYHERRGGWDLVRGGWEAGRDMRVKGEIGAELQVG